MTRAYCPQPDHCQSGKRGICPCQVDELLRQRKSAASKKALADPEVRQRISAASKKAWAAKTIPIPDHLKSYAAKLRRCGIRGDDLRKALEAAQ